MKLKDRIKKIVKSDFFKNLVIYTLIFGLLITFLISIFYNNGKGFIWNTDGIDQHIVNLRYFRELLVNFIRTGNFSTFTWYVGNGFDLFSNFAWYISGDFFSYLSIFVRTKDIDLMYYFLIILRFYCIGVSFLCFAKYKKMNTFSSIVGTLIYTFSSFVLWASVRHPYFMNPIILLPLAMIGIEKIIVEDKKVFYTIIISLMFISNFYFAYSNSIILLIYGISLAICTYKKEGIKKIIKVLIKTFIYSLLGIMISAISLLPTAFSYVSSDRISGNNISVYPLYYYRKVINQFLTQDEIGFWSCLGIQSLAFVTVPLFIMKKKKENTPLFVLMIALFFPLLIAQFGSVFAGFNFPSNRWTYAFSFVFSFITMIVLNSKYKLETKDLLSIFVLLIVFLGIDVIFEIKISIYTMLQIILLFVWIILISFKEKLENMSKKINVYNLIFILLITFGISMSIKFLYDVNGTNYVSQFFARREFTKLANTSKNSIPDFKKAINYIKDTDTDFYNIAKYPYTYEDVSLVHHFNSTGVFYSIIPESYAGLSLSLNNTQFHPLRGDREFDYRTKINSLLGVKYLISYKGKNIPYGYTEVADYNGKSKIYKNDYNLPFGVLYTNYINENEYDNLSPLEKESSLLKATVLENNKTNNKENFTYDYSNIKEIKYEIIDENDSFVDSNKILIDKSSKKTFKLKLSDIKNKELYVSFENLEFQNFDKNEMISLQLDEDSTLLDVSEAKYKYKWYQPSGAYDLTVKYQNNSKKYSVRTWYSAYYVDTNDFLFNLGYYDEANGEITVTLSSLGNYTFDSLKVYAVSMDDYEEDIENLRKSNFEVTDYGNGYLNGTVNAEEKGILQFQTFYNKGWKVYVDNKEVETLRSNKYFLGINIGTGKHDIRLEYKTPYLKEGIVVSFAGIAIFITVTIINKKKNKKLINSK